MFRYLTAAFLFSPNLGALGKLPLNLMFLAGVTILGFAHPGFFLLGLGLEVAYLFSFAFNPRFQRLIDSQLEENLNEDTEIQRQEMTKRLKPSSRARLIAQAEKCARISQAYKDSSAGEILVAENCKALDKLLCAHLALLLNRDKLEALGTEANVGALKRQIETAEQELQQTDLPDTVRNTKQATLEILRKRLENVNSREASLKEIDSALARIEAQLDLAYENAMMPERQYAIDADIEVASNLLDEKSYGEMNAVMQEIEKSGGQGVRMRV